MPDDEIRFFGTFPPIQSAIKVDGSGGGMRIQIDIPESEMGQAVMLLAMREQILDITVKTHGTTNSQAKSGKSGQVAGDDAPTPRRSAKKR